MYLCMFFFFTVFLLSYFKPLLFSFVFFLYCNVIFLFSPFYIFSFFLFTSYFYSTLSPLVNLISLWYIFSLTNLSLLYVILFVFLYLNCSQSHTSSKFNVLILTPIEFFWAFLTHINVTPLFDTSFLLQIWVCTVCHSIHAFIFECSQFHTSSDVIFLSSLPLKSPEPSLYILCLHSGCVGVGTCVYCWRVGVIWWPRWRQWRERCSASSVTWWHDTR